MVFYVPAEEEVATQEKQCWELIYIVQRLVARGSSGRMVLVCPASSTCSALVTGASKAIPLEFPELSVQRVHVPEGIDLLRSGGVYGSIG